VTDPLLDEPASKIHGKRWLPALYAAVLCSIPLLLSNRHSFWIDEALTWNVTRLGSLKEVLLAILDTARAGSSIAQSPGHLIYAWGWAQLRDLSEVWSRWSNIPWIALFGVAWWRLATLAFPNGWKEKAVFLALPVVSPFVVWYSVEYRPYAALIALGAVALVGLVTALNGDARGRWITVLAVAVAAYFHLLALVLIPCVATVLLFERKGAVRKVLREWKRELIVGILLLAPILAYYSYTLAIGARTFVASTTVKNLMFIVYEFLGFSGLGPSRHELHFDSSPSMFMRWLPTLALLAVPLALLLFRGVHRLTRAEPGRVQGPLRTMLVVGLIWGLGGIVLLWVAAISAEFRILGRHVAVLFPTFLAAVGILLLRYRLDRGWQWGLVLLVLLMQASSAARLMGTERHARDDYRGAVKLLREYEEPGQLTVVVADMDAYRYYDPTLESYAQSIAQFISSPQSGGVVIHNPSQSEWDSLLFAWRGPMVIVLGKPYFYDVYSTVGNWLTNQPGSKIVAAPPTFQVWTVGGNRKS
jgi:hypothetical protein